MNQSKWPCWLIGKKTSLQRWSSLQNGIKMKLGQLMCGQKAYHKVYFDISNIPEIS